MILKNFAHDNSPAAPHAIERDGTSDCATDSSLRLCHILAIKEVEDGGEVENVAEQIQPGLSEQNAMLA